MRAAAVILLLAVAHGSQAGTLRVCADPNNLPFSKRGGSGLEIRLAELVAKDLGVSLEVIWWPERRGLVRNTLAAGRCDALMGVPENLERVLATRPYYTSTYVFVTRADRGIAVRSFDDPALRRLRVGVHLIGDDGANAPPAHALARRGIVDNLVGFSIYGDYAADDPPAELVRAVARGDIDVAIAWGPLAGFVARQGASGLRLVPVAEPIDDGIPMRYAISVGVRKGDRALRDAIDAVLARRRPEIDALLDEYGVPR